MSAPAERSADRAYRLIRNDILASVLPGGSRLRENNLAEQYGFSRTPIRESLRRLQSEGLVEVAPHRGARVVNWRSFDIASISELRALVDSFVARTAARRISDKEISSLAKLCDEMEMKTDSGDLTDAKVLDRLTAVNIEFHRAIAAVAGGQRMVAIRNSVLVMPLVIRTVHDYSAPDRRRSNQHHRELLAAFKARDAEWAGSVMAAHVHAAKVRLMQDLPQSGAADCGTPGDGSGDATAAPQ